MTVNGTRYFSQRPQTLQTEHGAAIAEAGNHAAIARGEFGADSRAETPAKIAAGRVGEVRAAFGELKIRHQNIFAGRAFVDDQRVLFDQPIHGSGKPCRVDWRCVPALFDPSFQFGVHLFLGFFDAIEPLVSSVRVRGDSRIDIEQRA